MLRPISVKEPSKPPSCGEEGRVRTRGRLVRTPHSDILTMSTLGESSGESPLLDTPGRKPVVRERRFAQVFKDVTNTNPPEFDMLPLCDDASDDAGGWFAAAEDGTPQPEVEVRARGILYNA